MAEKFPRLSLTLPCPRMPGYCQGCGRTRHEIEEAGAHLITWIECDDFDKVTSPPVYLLLCTACDGTDEDGNPLPKGKKQPGKRSQKGMIERHPRLYEQPIGNAPNPGAMGMCRACAWRDGLSCTNPQSRLNGGPGIQFMVGPMVFVDGTDSRGRRAGWRMYSSPARSCPAFKDAEGVKS